MSLIVTELRILTSYTAMHIGTLLAFSGLLIFTNFSADHCSMGTSILFSKSKTKNKKEKLTSEEQGKGVTPNFFFIDNHKRRCDPVYRRQRSLFLSPPAEGILIFFKHTIQNFYKRNEIHIVALPLLRVSYFIAKSSQTIIIVVLLHQVQYLH